MDIVCHGQTPVMPDVNGEDPYAVSKKNLDACIHLKISIHFIFRMQSMNINNMQK